MQERHQKHLILDHLFKLRFCAYFITSPPFLTLFSLFPCMSCCCNCESEADLRLWSLLSLHHDRRSDLTEPWVVPLSKKVLPEVLNWCGWLPALSAMKTLGRATRNGSTRPQERSKVGRTWCHLRSKGCRWWVVLMLHHGEEQMFSSILVWKGWSVSLAFCITKNLISTGLQAPCKRKRWNLGLVKMLLLSGTDTFCSSWWSCSKLRSLMHNADFDLMIHVPFSRLACVLSNKGYIFSHIKGLVLYIMSMW